MALVNNPKPESHWGWRGVGFGRNRGTPVDNSPLRYVSLSQKSEALRPNDYGGSGGAGEVWSPFRRGSRPEPPGPTATDRKRKMTTSENDEANVPTEMARLAARVEAISERYALGIEAALDANDRLA